MRQWMGVLAAFVALGASLAWADAVEPTASDIASQYYQGIAGEIDFDAVPMAEGLTFRGPGRSAANATAFRAALRGLVPQVRSFVLRKQLADDEFVLTFYDLDLGAPSGPIPMAEKLHVENGEIVDVELVFDSRRLPPRPPSPSPGS